MTRPDAAMASPSDHDPASDGRITNSDGQGSASGGRGTAPGSHTGRSTVPRGQDADSDGQDAEALAALRALADAIGETSRVLPFVEDDDVTAYQCSRALDSAFADLRALLETVPALVGLGDPGRVVSERLERHRTELAARRADIAAHRVRLDELAGSERDLADVTAEADWLRDRVAELERANRMAEELPGLRARADALEEAVAAADAADAPDVSERIGRAAREFAALTERQREAAETETAQLIAEAEETARAVAELRARAKAAAAEMAAREDEARQLKAEHGETLRLLSAWHQADADLAAALHAAGLPSDRLASDPPAPGGANAGGLDRDTSPLRTVRAELTEISERLTRLDEALRPLLIDHAKAYEQARRPRSL
jgi:hypothetical protein